MTFTVSAGEALRIGDGVTLTILAVEGDLIRFRLEAPETNSCGGSDPGQENEAPGYRQRGRAWELI
jgi:hypothetical protein